MLSGYRLTLAIAVVAAMFFGTTLALVFTDNDTVAPAQAQAMDADRGISVQGEGQVAVVPDTVRVVLGVQLEGEEIEELREDANTRMDTVIDGLIADGIDESDIRTVTYDISVTRDWERQNAPIIGYTLTQLVEVKISDIDRTGEIIDNAVDNGANNVGNIRFEVEDRTAVIRQAREQAMENARDKAAHLAELGGVSLGAPIKISESSPSLPPIPFDEPAMDRAEMDEMFPVSRIEPGESIVTVYVNVTYAIE
jgi:uncharacterized protein